MATYSHPGVYVEESLTPLSNMFSDPSEAAAAFVGVSPNGGPVGPTQVTSWNQFQTLFGGIRTAADDLSYAVYSFFANGGGGCYVVRAVNDDATAADLDLNGTQAVPAPVVTVTATAPGTWASDAGSASRVYVTVTPSANIPGRFNLIIEVGSDATLTGREQFVDLSMNQSDARYAVAIVNSPTVGSKYVSLTDLNPPGGVFDATLSPAAASKIPLTGGSDGTGTPNLQLAVERLDTVDRDFVVNVPAASSEVVTDVVTWAEGSGRHFVVVDVPKPVAGEDVFDSVIAQTTFADSVPNSSYAAVYGPWQYTADPTSRAGSMRLTAPGGAVVGQYLRTDSFRGVHKAPAGVGTALVGVVAPAFSYTNPQQDTLVNSGVNLIKAVPGAGVCIMGSRTQNSGFADKYVPVRRLLIAIKSALNSVTRFAIFENNDNELWDDLDEAVTSYLAQQYELGAFKGSSQEQAFYVLCDATNNTQADADAGIVNVEVGVALQYPAEFIVIRLGQTAAGASATDSLEEA